jgi:cytochrome o ubiquinol oxidase subunit 2
MGRNSKYLLLFLLAFICEMALLGALYLHNNGPTVAVLNPQGVIAAKERSLIITATLLMLIVVIPVYVLTFLIVWKYREGNKKAKYTPDWDRHAGLEFAWWAIPGIIIAILAVITWHSSHTLDPFRPLASNKRPLTVQVVALQWKWLFIYPEQNIASINYLQIPAQTPINFQITSDAPMNSFWIPQLGGQVYAMSGMSTHLNLMADGLGTYRGVSANISGEGFAGMNFTVNSSTPEGFDQWVRVAHSSSKALSLSEYNKLARPSLDNPVAYYASSEQNLYGKVIGKFLGPVIGDGAHLHGDY